MSVTRDQLIDFIYDEARMLDEGRYDEWLALWLKDGHYWMPLDYNQTDPLNVTSLMYEDHLHAEAAGRASERCADLLAKAQEPLSSRLSAPLRRRDGRGGGPYVTKTFMHYVETRLDEQFLLALTARHELALVDGKLRIANKRVDILNCDAAFGNIQLLP
jgi:hypothetical protein